MKKIKLLLPVMALTMTVPTAVTIASCGNNDEDTTPRTVNIDLAGLGKVRVAKTEFTSDKDFKITFENIAPAVLKDITAVKIGIDPITKTTDYKYENNTLTIFKAVLKVKKGDVTVTPVTQEDETNRCNIIKNGAIVPYTPTTTPVTGGVYANDVALTQAYGNAVKNNPKIFYDDIACWFTDEGFTKPIQIFTTDLWFNLSNISVEVKEIDGVQTPLFNFIVELSATYKSEQHVHQWKKRIGKMEVKNFPLPLKFKPEGNNPFFNVDPRLDPSVYKNGFEKCGTSFSCWLGRIESDDTVKIDSIENANTADKFSNLYWKLSEYELTMWFFSYIRSVVSTYFEKVIKG